MQGTVSKWISKHGYGFVESAGNSYFLHYSDLPESAPRDLNEGDAVNFEPMTTEKGLRCRKVELVPAAVQVDDVSY